MEIELIFSKKKFFTITPIDFELLEPILANLNFSSINNLSIGIFDNEGIIENDEYYDMSNITKISSFEDFTLLPLFEFLHKRESQQIIIYKLEIQYNDFTVLYDDDALLIVEVNVEYSLESFNLLYKKFVSILE